MKLGLTSILLHGTQLVAARAVIRARSGSCDFVSETYSSSEGVTTVGTSIFDSGTTLYESSSSLSSSSLTFTIEPYQYTGRDVLVFAGDVTTQDYSFTGCGLTDLTTGQTYTGKVGNSVRRGSGSTPLSSCSITFAC